MKKINKENIFEYFIVFFLIIQPIFDLKIFYNSVSTLIRTVIVLGIFGIQFVKNKDKKIIKILLVYLFCVIFFFFFHHINALKFNSMVPGNFNYSCLKEILYFIKMFVPFLLIYILIKSEISNKKITAVIQILVIIISSNIIIANILGVSYGSYSDETIKANFFCWFNNNGYTYKDLASKGYFESANQISAVLLMFLPYTVYELFNRKSTKNIVVLILNTFALILLGTRVAVIGIAIVFVYTLAGIIFIKIIQKNNQIQLNKMLPILLCMLLYLIILPANPMFNRINEMNNQQCDIIQVSSNDIIKDDVEESNNLNDENGDINELKQENEISDNDNKKEEKVKFIEENYKSKKINEKFIFESYPYQYDTDFWIDIINMDIYKTTNYRYLETQMIKRVVEINNNKYDKLFGITYTRMQNIFNIEQDFIAQYYAIGIVGTLLVFLPYCVLILMFIFKTLKSKFKLCTVENLISCITIVMMFVIAYNSGNLLNSLSFTIYFAILFYKLYNKENLIVLNSYRR